MKLDPNGWTLQHNVYLFRHYCKDCSAHPCQRPGRYSSINRISLRRKARHPGLISSSSGCILPHSGQFIEGTAGRCPSSTNQLQNLSNRSSMGGLWLEIKKYTPGFINDSPVLQRVYNDGILCLLFDRSLESLAWELSSHVSKEA
jgi:hypothetical protein